MIRPLILRPCAKINLSLRVGPLGPDGYHDVRTLLQSIALHDTLTISPRSGPFALGTRAPGIPTDRSNLVWKAALALWRALGREGDPRGAHVRLEKSIPTAAGLGGGSANAAAALVGLNTVWNGRLSRPALHALAAGLGADVPFFLLGGTVLGAGRGDEVYPVDDVSRFGVVVIKPSFGVATADAYRWLDADRADGHPADKTATPVDVGWTHGPIAVTNDLQAPVARRHDGIGEMIDGLRRMGAIAAAMTGSGSAVFGLFRETAARAAARALARPDWLICLTRTLGRREAARHLGG
jgi:4-diphosphocytidyl-2-C-methyl-D-erythritol kinase